MVADYSSYLEFIGAVYFTMSLSDYLTTKIWSPQDAKKINRSLDGLGMKDDDDFKQAVLDANKKKGEKLQAELSKKSLIGIFVVAFLLLFVGFEPSLSGNENQEASSLLQLELVYTCAYFLLSLFTLQWIIFNKWKYVILYILSNLVFFFVIRWKTFVFNQYEIESYLTDNVGMVVCITITIPILWQIFITWLHKSVFYGYVKSKIQSAQEEYKKVLDYANKHEFEKLPKRYHEIYMRISQAASATSPQQIIDDSLTEYKGVLYNDVRVIGLNVRLYQLLLSWFKYKVWRLWKWIKELFSSRGKIVSNPNKLMVTNYAEYAEKYKRYKQKKSTLKMKDFCEAEQIDFVEFNKYYSKYCQIK